MVVKDKTFKLPDKRILKKAVDDIQYIVVDVTESPIQRPRKDQKTYYSGKKRHTLKTQVIVEGKKGKIIDIRERKGCEHDFSLYKSTIGNELYSGLEVYADLGYLGIQTYHEMSSIPRKASKKHPLSTQDKAFNKRLAKKRVIVEHINAKIKTFKCMSYPYRNHYKRHLLRMFLICGIINPELRI